MTDKELLQMALEALETVFMPHHPAVISLRDRLALSYVPKVWMQCPECGKKSPMPDPDHKEWRGLTEAQAGAMWKKDMTPFDFARAIEAKLREKNA